MAKRGSLFRRMRESLGLGGRRQYQAENRLHLELRPLGARDHEYLSRRLKAVFARIPGVERAVVMLALSRIVLIYQDGQPVDARLARACLGALEAELGTDNAPFSEEYFPGEANRRRLLLVEAATDALGLLASLLSNTAGGDSNRPWMIDIAALATAFEYTPLLRKPLEARIGRVNTELLLNTVRAIDEGLQQGWSGSLLDLFQRLLALRSEREQQRAFRDWEPRLCTPDGRDEAWPQRPVPLRNGAIERYINESVTLTAGGFGFGVAATHSFEQAAAPIFSGVPRPALMARLIHASEIARAFSQRGVLVAKPQALHTLDRIDVAVLDGALFRAANASVSDVHIVGNEAEDAIRTMVETLFLPQDILATQRAGGWQLMPVAPGFRVPAASREWAQHHLERGCRLLALRRTRKLQALVAVRPLVNYAIEAVVAKLRALNLGLVILAEDATDVAWAMADEVVHPSAMARTVAQWQEDGSGVLLVTDHALDNPPNTADVMLSLNGTAAEGVSIYGTSLDHVWMLLCAIETTRTMATQSVELSRMEAVGGLILSLNKLGPRTLRRIALAAHGAALVAAINAVRLIKDVHRLPEGLHADITPWHAMDITTVLERLESRTAGLFADEALARVHDTHKVSEGTALRFLRAWQAELVNPLTPVLAAGAALSALTGAVVDAGLILAVTAINALISGSQRFQTDVALAALSEEAEQSVRVWRDAQLQALQSSQLVIGDVIELEAGERVPADLRVLQAAVLEVDESSLTGESVPVRKTAAACRAMSIAERSSMLYEGTSIASGSVRGIVVALGDDTEARRAHLFLHRSHGGSGVEARLQRLTEMTMPVAMFSAMAVMASGLSRGLPSTEIISTGVSLAVAAVPEGLPLMATLAQLSSANRLSKRGSLVRNPRAIEALGRITVLCADKTGTLTEGRLRLTKIITADGEFDTASPHSTATNALRVAMMATPLPTNGETLPHVTDQAVLDALREHHGTLLDELRAIKRLEEIPFSSDRPWHAVRVMEERNHRIYLKGAPEQLITACKTQTINGSVVRLHDAGRNRLLAQANELAGRGLRVLALAQGDCMEDAAPETPLQLPLVFAGFIALADPIRATAKQAIGDLQAAGIGIRMITGDHPATARSIADELGISGEVMTGAELDSLKDADLEQRLSATGLFARVTPMQKARIVRALQARGEVVAMTGDGANDAPAIRLADVGIALGERATPAARASADMLVLDERIESIVQAILEGRALWASVRDAVSLLVGGNLGEIGFALLGGVLDGRSPLNARQLLVNLLTDSLPALSVALRRPQNMQPADLRGEGPEVSLGDSLTHEIEWRAALTAAAASGAWLSSRGGTNEAEAGTVGLLATVGAQMAQTLLVGRGSPMVLTTCVGSMALLLAIVQTPALSRFFGCTPLSIGGLTRAALATGASAAAAWAAPRLYPRVQSMVEEFETSLADYEIASLPDVVRQALAYENKPVSS